MSGHLRDEGPLPEAALRALAYENEKSARLDRYEKALALIAYGDPPPGQSHDMEWHWEVARAALRDDAA